MAEGNFDNAYKYADIGVDQDKVSALYETINSHLINDSIQEIDADLKAMFNVLGNIWTGPSYEEYKDYVEDNFKTLKSNLKDLSDEMDKTIKESAGAAYEADQTAATFFKNLDRE